MNRKKFSLFGIIGTILVFLIQWGVTDILDNQTFFTSPHVILEDYVSTTQKDKTNDLHGEFNDNKVIKIDEDSYSDDRNHLELETKKKYEWSGFDRLTKEELEARIPLIINEKTDNILFQNQHKFRGMIVHIVLLVIVVLILLGFSFIIFFGGNGAFAKFVGVGAFAFMIYFVVSFFMNNTEYKYVITNAYGIESITLNKDVYCVRYNDSGNLAECEIDSSVVQVVEIVDEDSLANSIYCVKRKAKNIWYYLTEKKSGERDIYLIY